MADYQDVPALKRAVRVLEAVTERGSVSPKELSMDLSIPPTTCYRILHSLKTAGMLRQDVHGDFQLSFGITRLGNLAATMARFYAQLREPLSALAEQHQCIIKISVREGDDWLILDRHEAIPAPVPQGAGSRDSAVIGSVGAVLLRDEDDGEIDRLIHSAQTDARRIIDPEQIRARIARCREKGYATDLAETFPCIHAISVPLNPTMLEVPAALTAVFHPDQLPPPRVVFIVKALEECANRIGACGPNK